MGEFQETAFTGERRHRTIEINRLIHRVHLGLKSDRFSEIVAATWASKSETNASDANSFFFDDFYHHPKVESLSVPHYPHRGRRNKDQLPTRIAFQVVGEVVELDEAIEQAKRSKGKFVIAANELDTT